MKSVGILYDSETEIVPPLFTPTVSVVILVMADPWLMMQVIAVSEAQPDPSPAVWPTRTLALYTANPMFTPKTVNVFEPVAA